MYSQHGGGSNGGNSGNGSPSAILQEFEEAWRKECITAIDAKNRSIGRDVVKNGTGGVSGGGNSSSPPPTQSSSSQHQPNLINQALIDPVD